MADGLYRVQRGPITAGLVIHAGHVDRCAPVLRRRLDYWLTIAQRIGP